MTDRLMDDLTNEEHEALLLMSEHAIAAPLSPAAKAVLDAFTAGDYGVWLKGDPGRIAATLRAAADQVAPECDMPILGDDSTHGAWCARNDVRDDLLGIAAELEGL